MKSRRVVWVVLIMAVLAAGCASWPRMPETSRQCSDTPQNAVLTFLKGMAELSLSLIKSVLPEGRRAYVVFGDGDEERGKAVVQQIIEHPEITKGNEVGSTFFLEDMETTPEPATKRVLVARRDQVILVREDGREVEQLYHRWFLVGFDSSNCITRVVPLGKNWSRVR